MFVFTTFFLSLSFDLVLIYPVAALKTNKYKTTNEDIEYTCCFYVFS